MIRREPIQVLIVDDNSGFRMRARRWLEADGYEVVAEAADGASALGAARRHRPDVVLLDIELPDMSGLALAERFAREPGPPAVVLTSTHDASDFGEPLTSCGARGFLPKAELSPERLSELSGAEVVRRRSSRTRWRGHGSGNSRPGSAGVRPLPRHCRPCGPDHPDPPARPPLSGSSRVNSRPRAVHRSGAGRRSAMSVRTSGLQRVITSILIEPFAQSKFSKALPMTVPTAGLAGARMA
jgi:CheY-like chemotaxis protein